MEERFTPEMVINHYITNHNITIDDIGVAPVVVASWGRQVIHSMAEKFGAEPSPHWMYGDRQPFFSGEIDGQRVSLVQLPVGAPGTVMIMEEMIACGAHTFIGLGWAGSLQASAPIGTFLIPTSCVIEEGTSSHYVNNMSSIHPDETLIEILKKTAQSFGVQTCLGPQWTTDAPYRELRSKIETYGEQGVLGVDMETSAMYALGNYRKVRVANLLVVSDELRDQWRPAFGTKELLEATEKAQDVVAQAITMIVNEND